MKKAVKINSFYMVDFVERPTGMLTMNVYVPESDKPVPVILWLIGSGFKDYCNFAYDPPIMSMLEHGFAVARTEYRMSYDAVFPAQIQDARAGVRFLRKHADEFGIDPGRIGASGESAGGQLSLLLGLASNMKVFDDDPYGEYSAKVQAVCENFGPADMTKTAAWRTKPNLENRYAEDLFGGEYGEHRVMELAKLASPITYLGQGKEIPYKIFHGDNDLYVPFQDSVTLYQKMKELDYDVEFTPVPGYGHSALLYMKTRDEFLEFYKKHFQIP